MDMGELKELSNRIENDLFEMAEVMFPHQPEDYISVTERIGEWAITQKAVLEFLASENPNNALIFDKICYRIWQQLPSYAQCVKIDLSGRTHNICG